MARGAVDARRLLAAERTLLAWLRTAVSLMAFGFVVARFDWFIHRSTSTTGTVLGAGLTASGGAFATLAAARFWHEAHSGDHLVPGPWLAISVAGAVAVAGLLVTGYLLVHRLAL